MLCFHPRKKPITATQQLDSRRVERGGLCSILSREKKRLETPNEIKAPGIVLQKNPLIYLTTLPGKWLLEHTTPVWRIKDPIKGFQRVVKEERAKDIAIAVLNQQRTFPNAIVLATDSDSFELRDCTICIPSTTCLLVVDGQHRLYSQAFSSYEATFACLIHMRLTEVDMARLFLEINDTQKRVPSSLRWDLVRLVRPEQDKHAITASELVYALATNEESPLYQRIDLTGEQPEISLKQGSLAPDIRLIISNRSFPLRDLDFEDQYEVLTRYFSAIKDLDPDGWRIAKTTFYQARVLRALIRLLPEIIRDQKKKPLELTAEKYLSYLRRMKRRSLSPEKIRAAQGSAGIKAIYSEIKKQVFRK